MWFSHKIIRAKRVSNWHTPQKKSARLPACTCQKILVLVFTYVSTTYVRTSARYRICIYVCAFRPCTSTSDDSYIYQLSLVLATASVSLSRMFCRSRPNQLLCGKFITAFTTSYHEDESFWQSLSTKGASLAQSMSHSVSQSVISQHLGQTR